MSRRDAGRQPEAEVADGVLRDLRSSMGMRQADLAERLGISQGAVSRREAAPIGDQTVEALTRHVEAVDPGASVYLERGKVVIHGTNTHLVVRYGPAGRSRVS